MPLNRGKTKESYTRKADGNHDQASSMVIIVAPIALDSGAAASDPNTRLVSIVANHLNTIIALPTAQTTILLDKNVKITGRILLDQGSQQSLIKKSFIIRNNIKE